MAQPPTNDTAGTTSRDEGSNAVAQNSAVKIKQEKIDPEIEKKIKLLKEYIKTKPPDNTDTDTRDTNGHMKNKDSQYNTDDEEDSDSDSSSQDTNKNGIEGKAGEDEKKNIAPVKSSNEILTELFQVFNVAPPEELLGDKNLIKKGKKHKKDKKKKHKKQKDEDLDTEVEDGECIGGEKHKYKKSKKKHKHKHKDGSKDKDKTKNKDKEKDKDKYKERAKSKDKDRTKEKSKSGKKSAERDRSRDRERSNDRGRSKDRAKSKEREKRSIDTKLTKSTSERKRYHDKEDSRPDTTSKRKKMDEKGSRKSNSFYNGFKEREGSRKHSEEGINSDTSLSDEETYWKEKESRSDFSKHRVHNSFYDGPKRSRSRDREHNRGHSKESYRDRDRDRDRDYDRDRDSSYRNRGFSRRYHSRYSRSRSRSRSRDLGIDKKRLLEIARKNAISMFKLGNLPGCDNLSQEVKDKVLLKMRYGGRTVEDLTEFCKKISNGENLSDLSSDEDSDLDKAGNAKAFHHPFQLKEREPIVMHIRNSKPILPVLSKTEEQTKAITMQFPVSSGQQHRMTEHWVPVEVKDNLTPLPALPAATQTTAMFKSNLPKNALGKPLPITEEQEPAFKPVPTPSSETVAESPAAMPTAVVEVPITVPPPPTPLVAPAVPATMPPSSIPLPPTTSNVTSSVVPAFVPDVPVPSTNNCVFPQANCGALDVSSIISKRLNAMRRLQENPMDSEAIKMMHNSQREMSSWASSKHLPGQFTGSTGVNVLKPNQLNSGPQVWARRDQLKSTKPVTGGMGMHLLQKMGWKPGEGLGREKNGSLQPLLLDVKLDKRGLIAQEDRNQRAMPLKRKVQLVQQNPEGKHPVCLLNELTTKRKWIPPLYTLVNEKGPSHSKMFLFSVQVNGQTFTPEKACNTKKEAKMIAAKRCLQQIGILPEC